MRLVLLGGLGRLTCKYTRGSPKCLTSVWEAQERQLRVPACHLCVLQGEGDLGVLLLCA